MTFKPIHEDPVFTQRFISLSWICGMSSHRHVFLWESVMFPCQRESGSVVSVLSLTLPRDHTDKNSKFAWSLAFYLGCYCFLNIPLFSYISFLYSRRIFIPPSHSLLCSSYWPKCALQLWTTFSETVSYRTMGCCFFQPEDETTELELYSRMFWGVSYKIIYFLFQITISLWHTI